MKKILLFSILVWMAACKNNSLDAPKNLEAPQTITLFQQQKIDQSKILQAIAFGSCNRQDLPQEMWQYIRAQHPDLWIWLGDNIYGDSEDMSVLESKYRQIKFNEEYIKLRQEVPIIGTWDDHDYGLNDAGKDYAKRQESQNLLLDFLDVPKEATVRQIEGVYQSYTFGEIGQKTKVILLDARYFRDEQFKYEGPDQQRRYIANPDGDILGETQWQWLENELLTSKSQVHIIGSGIQVLPEEHGWEKWANFPKARQRLFSLIEKIQPANLVFISGDRHIAEVSKFQSEKMTSPIYDVTSSGLTHTWSTISSIEENKHRVGKFVIAKNFGVLKIDWSNKKPTLKVEIRGLANQLLDEVKLVF